MEMEVVHFDTRAWKWFYPRVDICAQAKRVSISSCYSSRLIYFFWMFQCYVNKILSI